MNKWIVHELNEDHKRKRFEISFALNLRNQNDPFLKRIVTCDEKWMFYDNRKCLEHWLYADKALQHLLKSEIPSKEGYGDCLVILN